MLRLRINGRWCEGAEGATVLQVLRSHDVHIPTLCHDPRLKPFGGCRLCLVRIGGKPNPVAACTTPAAEGMEIETHPPDIEDLRRSLLQLLTFRHPAEDARSRPGKEFYRLLAAYGVDGTGVGGGERRAADDSHPYLHVDMSRCVLCYRCVRICEEVQGQFIWTAWYRGARTQIRPGDGPSLLESGCVSCGACADTCPTGAIEDRSVLALGEPETRTKTTCPYCGTGCEMSVGVRAGRLVTIAPERDSPVNKGHLCVKGRYAFEFVYAEDRVTHPLIRRAGGWERASWDETLSFTAERLREVLGRHGPDAIAVLGSARATNEENYLAQKFARAAIGTNNVDCCARVCHGPTAAAMKLMLGTGAATNSYDDIELARCLLVCGANATENHPVIGARLKQAALRGTPLIVIDPRAIELTRYATLHLALRPGTNVPLFNALACAIVEEGLADESFVRERVEEWDDFRAFISAYRPEDVASLCGVEAALIRKAARLYATARPAMSLHGLGMTEHVQGTEGVMCLVNLALLTGNLGKPGSGINPLRGQNNVQGSAHMGCDPGTLTGSISIKDGKALFERVWGTPLPTRRGLNLLQMMDAAEANRLKALWVMGYDVLLTNADAHRTRKAMKNLDLVIVQDLFLNETAKEFGTVFLPAASSFEKDGTFMNAERRIQMVRKVIEPIGESKSDWEIVCLLAAKMGRGNLFPYRSAEEIWDEIRAVWNAGAGINYARLATGGIQWPCPSGDHPGTKILHTETFPIGPKAVLRCVEYRPTAEAPTEVFPLLLTTGRSLYHFNAGTMTMRTENAKLRPTDLIEISPVDASRLGLVEGGRAKVVSRYGEAVLPVTITSTVKPGELFATFQDPRIFLNHITSPFRDKYVKAPEYKVTAVRLEKA
ncbi:MAG: formate dehydrogenase subunit alpha [Nitrospirae bacterium]|nr:formate dehydrogenase subunit alpha [Nitrospirota bacterium]